jgi:hypothetical protein
MYQTNGPTHWSHRSNHQALFHRQWQKHKWSVNRLLLTLLVMAISSGCFSYEGMISDPAYRDSLDWGNKPLNIPTCYYFDSGTDLDQAYDLINGWNLGEGQDYGIFFTPVAGDYEDRSPADYFFWQINQHFDEMVERHGHRECRKHVWFLQHNIGDQAWAAAAVMWGLPEVFGDQMHEPEVKNGDLVEAPASGMWMYENDYMIDPVGWMFAWPSSRVFAHETRHMLGCDDHFAIGPFGDGGYTMDGCYDRIHEYKTE